ncbi:MAG TPA: archease, partial [Isosphaeraceae bacterium]|nr:archease [Isosphaeraceae bacterium]
RTAAEAVFDYIVTNRDEVRAESADSIALEADTPGDLLVSWLNELIFLCETRHRLYTRFDVRVLDGGTRLEAEVWGEGMDPNRHVLDHEVKAVTRHDFDLHPQEGGWVATLILDI